MRFYFVSYAWMHPGDACWGFSEAVLAGEHPVAALIRWRDRDREENPHGGRTSTCYALISWQEITEDEYNLFEGQVG